MAGSPSPKTHLDILRGSDYVVLALDGFYMVDLVCDPELRPFYERFGMDAGTGMMFRNFDKQSGQ